MRLLTSILAVALLQLRFAVACELHTLPVAVDRVQAGDINVALGEADDPQHPTAWQGPLQVGSADRHICTVSDDVAIIEKPLLLGNGHILFVPTYSGSTNRVYAVDLKDCRVLWKSPEFSGATAQEGNVLVTGSRKLPLPMSCLP